MLYVGSFLLHKSREMGSFVVLELSYFVGAFVCVTDFIYFVDDPFHFGYNRDGDNKLIYISIRLAKNRVCTERCH